LFQKSFIKQNDIDDDIPLVQLIENVNDDLPLSELRDSWMQLRKNIPLPENVTADDFLNVDNSIETRLNPCETDLMNLIRIRHSKDQDTHSPSYDSDVQEIQPVSVYEFFSALDTVRKFLGDREPDEKLYKCCSELEAFGYEALKENRKQSKITVTFITDLNCNINMCF
jgi:hypothetical protein